MSMNLYLGKMGEEILLPSAGRAPLVIEEIENTRGEDMASGRYVEDIRWRKKQFTIAYDEIKGDFLRSLISLYNERAFLNFIYTDSGGILKNYEVKMAPFVRTRNSYIGDEVWTNISLVLRATRPE